MFYPLIAVGADLIYSSWWMPISIFTNKWPFPSEFVPIYLLTTFLTSAIFFGTLLFASKKTIQRRWSCFGAAVTAVDEEENQQREAVGVVQAAVKNNLDLPPEKLSTRYLLLMISFFTGGVVTIDGFRFALANAFTPVVATKVGFCLFLFVTCCIAINSRNYFNDLNQRRYLTSLSLSFVQTILALATLLFWTGLKLVFFGSK